MEASSHDHDRAISGSPAALAPAVEPPRRIFLRMKSSDPAKEYDILLEYYRRFGHGKEINNQNDFHHWHQQPREYRHYHIVIDLYFVQNPIVDVEQVPHQVYLVRTEAGTKELLDYRSSERPGLWLTGAQELHSYWGPRLEGCTRFHFGLSLG